MKDFKFFTLAVFLCVSVMAHSLESSKMLTPFGIGLFDGKKKSQRDNVAKKLINNLEALDSRIPVLTQLEKQELIDKDNKIEAIKKNNGDFIQLRVDFENSSLYLKKQLHEVIKLSTNALNCTVQETNPKKEMYCWTIVASIIGDAKYWKTSMDTLVDEGDLPNQNIPGLYRTDLTWAIFNGYSQGIIAIILIPYMHDELVQSENQEAPTE